MTRTYLAVSFRSNSIGLSVKFTLESFTQSLNVLGTTLRLLLEKSKFSRPYAFLKTSQEMEEMLLYFMLSSVMEEGSALSELIAVILLQLRSIFQMEVKLNNYAGKSMISLWLKLMSFTRLQSLKEDGRDLILLFQKIMVRRWVSFLKKSSSNYQIQLSFRSRKVRLCCYFRDCGSFLRPIFSSISYQTNCSPLSTYKF